MRRQLRFTILLSALVLPWQAQADSTISTISSELTALGQAFPPHGFVEFCAREPAECVTDSKGVRRPNLIPALKKELANVNRSVNKKVVPVTDRDHYKGQLNEYGLAITERWALPRDGMGDCEDYVLQKRHDLIALNWPTSSLLVTVVRDKKGDGHAVLTVRTAQGDFILDNFNDEVMPWYDTMYHFVMMQSQENPTVWVSLEPPQSPATAAVK